MYALNASFLTVVNNREIFSRIKTFCNFQSTNVFLYEGLTIQNYSKFRKLFLKYIYSFHIYIYHKYIICFYDTLRKHFKVILYVLVSWEHVYGGIHKETKLSTLPTIFSWNILKTLTIYHNNLRWTYFEPSVFCIFVFWNPFGTPYTLDKSGVFNARCNWQFHSKKCFWK